MRRHRGLTNSSIRNEKMSYYFPDKLTIVVRDATQHKNKDGMWVQPLDVIAKMKFDSHIDQAAVGKLLDFLAAKVYTHDPVRFDVQISGTNG